MKEQIKTNIFIAIKIIGKVLKWGFIILFGGIVLLFKFINDLAK